MAQTTSIMVGQERVEIGPGSEITIWSEMSSRWLWKHLTLTNMFTLICSILTFLLICQELRTFVFLKPTTTYKREKETLICLEPGFDPVALKKYLFRRVNKYYRGSLDGVKFVGWNGGMEMIMQTNHHRLSWRHY